MKKGFTLIELLVVVLIIGILSSVALPQYTKAVHKARLTEVQMRSKALRDAVELYLLEDGSANYVRITELYPDTVAGLTEDSSNNGQFKSKYGTYSASCEGTNCSVWHSYNSSDFSVNMISTKSLGQDWTNICYYQGQNKNSKYLCDSLQGNGYTPRDLDSM